MEKPTCYLWKSDFSTQEEFLAEKEKYRNLGFRVTTYSDGPEDTDLHQGLKALIRNHSN